MMGQSFDSEYPIGTTWTNFKEQLLILQKWIKHQIEKCPMQNENEHLLINPSIDNHQQFSILISQTKR